MYDTYELYCGKNQHTKKSNERELVCVVDISQLHKLPHLLAQECERYSNYTECPRAQFVMPVFDLFGEVRFGYNHIGYATFKGRKVHLRVPISRPNFVDRFYTICILLNALSELDPHNANSSKPTTLSVRIRENWNGAFEIDGRVPIKLIDRIRTQKAFKVSSTVRDTMRSVWRATVPPEAIENSRGTHFVEIGEEKKVTLDSPTLDWAYGAQVTINHFSPKNAVYSQDILEREQCLVLLSGLIQLCRSVH